MDLPSFLQKLAIGAFITAKGLIAPVALAVVALIEDEQGRVLLVRHSYGKGWGLPGGGVDRGEPVEDAVLRELREEIGLIRSAPPQFLALYTRKVGWMTNVIALYRLSDVEYEFKPTLEIRELAFADPANLPRGTGAGTVRRLAEWCGKSARSPYW